MPTPTTKVAIALRVNELNQQLQQRKATASSQQDERRELVDSCHLHGDHVPEPQWVPSLGSFAYHCGFCQLQIGVSQQQLSRNLVRG